MNHDTINPDELFVRLLIDRRYKPLRHVALVVLILGLSISNVYYIESGSWKWIFNVLLFIPLPIQPGAGHVSDFKTERMEQHCIAPCGLNCALCHAFQRGKCTGCRHRATETRKSCGQCVILQCGKYTRYCYECEKPCKRLKALDERYRTKYGVSVFENLRYIREYGEQAFILLQKQKYTCPACGHLRTVHYNYCIYCKTKKVRIIERPGACNPHENHGN